MSIELVTGFAGRSHIDGDDWGHLNASLAGPGRYVLDSGSRLAATVASANSVTVADGEALLHGRHVRVTDSESVTIDGGSQGQNRNDVVGILYSRAESGVETASLRVYKGTPSAGAAADPALPSGSVLDGATEDFMPLWRVPVSGLTPGAPQRLFEVLPALDAVRTQGYAPTRALTDMLEVDVSDMAGDANAPAKVVAADGRTLVNLPPGVAASEPVIGARRVFGLGGHVVVELTLGHPARGTWLNFYNGGSKRWEGWVRLATADDLSAALPPERRARAFTRVYVAQASTQDIVVLDEGQLKGLCRELTGGEDSAGNPCASVSNGDWDAAPVRVESTIVQGGQLLAHLSVAVQAGTRMRLNVLVGFGGEL